MTDKVKLKHVKPHNPQSCITATMIDTATIACNSDQKPSHSALELFQVDRLELLAEAEDTKTLDPVARGSLNTNANSSHTASRQPFCWTAEVEQQVIDASRKGWTGAEIQKTIVPQRSIAAVNWRIRELRKHGFLEARTRDGRKTTRFENQITEAVASGMGLSEIQRNICPEKTLVSVLQCLKRVNPEAAPQVAGRPTAGSPETPKQVVTVLENNVKPGSVPGSLVARKTCEPLMEQPSYFHSADTSKWRPLARWTRWTPEMEEQLIEATMGGVPIDFIQQQTLFSGISSATIKDYVRRLQTEGVFDALAREGSTAGWTAEQDAKLLQLRQNGLKCSEISATAIPEKSTIAIVHRLRSLFGCGENLDTQDLKFCYNWSLIQLRILAQAISAGLSTTEIRETFFPTKTLFDVSTKRRSLGLFELQPRGDSIFQDTSPSEGIETLDHAKTESSLAKNQVCSLKASKTTSPSLNSTIVLADETVSPASKSTNVLSLIVDSEEVSIAGDEIPAPTLSKIRAEKDSEAITARGKIRKSPVNSREPDKSTVLVQTTTPTGLNTINNILVQYTTPTPDVDSPLATPQLVTQDFPSTGNESQPTSDAVAALEKRQPTTPPSDIVQERLTRSQSNSSAPGKRIGPPFIEDFEAGKDSKFQTTSLEMLTKHLKNEIANLPDSRLSERSRNLTDEYQVQGKHCDAPNDFTHEDTHLPYIAGHRPSSADPLTLSRNPSNLSELNGVAKTTLSAPDAREQESLSQISPLKLTSSIMAWTVEEEEKVTEALLSGKPLKQISVEILPHRSYDYARREFRCLREILSKEVERTPELEKIVRDKIAHGQWSGSFDEVLSQAIAVGLSAVDVKRYIFPMLLLKSIAHRLEALKLNDEPQYGSYDCLEKYLIDNKRDDDEESLQNDSISASARDCTGKGIEKLVDHDNGCDTIYGNTADVAKCHYATNNSAIPSSCCYASAPPDLMLSSGPLLNDKLWSDEQDYILCDALEREVTSIDDLLRFFPEKSKAEAIDRVNRLQRNLSQGKFNSFKHFEEAQCIQLGITTSRPGGYEQQAVPQYVCSVFLFRYNAFLQSQLLAQNQHYERIWNVNSTEDEARLQAEPQRPANAPGDAKDIAIIVNANGSTSRPSHLVDSDNDYGSHQAADVHAPVPPTETVFDHAGSSEDSKPLSMGFVQQPRLLGPLPRLMADHLQVVSNEIISHSRIREPRTRPHR
ncbi:hypothetical protein MMC18_000311 [Xylographa bjoerkii]|nr:hypothetical protein [Xylographa bjoerkii]